MNRLFILFALLLAWAGTASAADIPPRPKPFTFVNDQANMLNANDAKKLENGLRKYADTYGTQVVLVTVPSLGGSSAADYARKLGTSWGVGQRDKNNGIVVLLSGKERQMSIEAGSGLRSVITPELTRRVINQEMTPAFKQGNYFAGLSKGLGTIMRTANPSSDPRKSQDATTPATASSATAPSGTSSLNDNAATTTPDAYQNTPTPEPASSGIGLGTILIGVVVIGGGIWLVSKLFNRNKNTASQAPDFTGNGNRPNTSPTPNFGAPNQGQGNYGGGYGGQAPSSGPGIGGMLATGAAAAAGAYLGNRMAGSGDHDTNANNFGTGAAAGLGGAGTVPPANAGSDYFASRDGDAASNDAGPDYFSGNDNADSSDSFFSDSGSYDDSSSGDTGGGGFDSTNDDSNSGSW
jgi:uncharacterized membrane protein YgcG